MIITYPLLSRYFNVAPPRLHPLSESHELYERVIQFLDKRIILHTSQGPQQSDTSLPHPGYEEKKNQEERPSCADRERQGRTCCRGWSISISTKDH